MKYHAGARTDGAARPDVRDDGAEPEPPRGGEPGGRRAWRAPPARCADAPGAPRFDGGVTLPILIHGDAAFPGQGIVAETLNLSRLAGYDTGGTIHIIANNQLGFTATPAESYSTSYASGLARGFKIPIVHVNADDPVACLEAARLAWEYRARFRRDFLIDLIGYRRYGHNEGDEPAFTQPVMYKTVAAHPTVRELFAQTLVAAGQRSPPETPDALVKKHFAVLEQAFASLKPEEDFVAPMPEPVPAGVAGEDRDRRAARAAARDQRGAARARPTGFTFHKKLERGRERRQRRARQPDRAHRSTGPPPRSWRSPRSWPTASRSG